MRTNYQDELNIVVVKFVNVLCQVDPEMNELGAIINRRLSKHDGDISYFGLLSRINNISQKLIECYKLIGVSAGEINLCVQRLRNINISESDNSFIQDYPKSINDFTILINNHIQFIKSINQCLIDWNGDKTPPEFLINTDMKIFDYVNKLESSTTFYNKTTFFINEFLNLNS